MSTVWFVVDDTDPRLSYSGSWSFIPDTGTFSGSGDIDGMSITGPAFNSTLHHTTGNGSISFLFNGSSYLGVYGTLDGQAQGQLPIIRCSLDGADMQSFDVAYPQGFTNNNNIACRGSSVQPGLSPGEHELVINVTNINSDWYFDYITYESLANPVLDGEILQAGNGELISPSNYSMLTFGPGWGLATNDLNSSVTTSQGSQATIKFNGTSISLYGSLNGSISNTAMYTVDEQDPVTFELSGSVSGSLNFNQLLFAVSNLSTVREHAVVVMSNGTAQGMPLDINYFLMTSLTAAQQAPPSLASPTAVNSPTPQVPHSIQSHTGMMVGVVLGAVIAFAAMAAMVTLWIRRSKRLRCQEILYPIPFQTKDIGHHITSMIYKKHSSGLLSAAEPSELRDTHQPSSANILTMKLQQRVIVMRDQIDQRDRQLAEGSMQRHRLLTVHTDSGLRGIEARDEEQVLDPGLVLDGPPGYTPA